MKNIKDKKTEADLDNLILSLTKNKITESTRKETEFKLGALFVYLLMIKVNTKKGTNNIKKYNPSIIVIESHLKSINEILKSKIYIFLVKKNYKLRSWNFFSLIFTLKNSTIIRNR